MRAILAHLGFTIALVLGVFGLLVGLAILGGGAVTSRWPAAGPIVILVALAWLGVLVYRVARTSVSFAKRVVLAFFIAPILPILVPASIVHLNQTYHPLSIFILLSATFYALQVVVGLPAYLLFRRSRRHPLWAYATVGFCALSLPWLSAVLYRCPEKGCPPLETAYYTSYLGLLGAAAAVIFWLVARPGYLAPR